MNTPAILEAAIYIAIPFQFVTKLAMDTVMILDNSSASDFPDAPTGTAQNDDGIHMIMNCTPLNALDLQDVFIRMDIGNNEFWGSMTNTWKRWFLLYCTLFYVALFLVLFCSCIGLLIYVLRRSFMHHIPRAIVQAAVYLLILCFLWLTFSFVHGIILYISITNGSDKALANSARTLETITSSSFVSIIVVAIFSHPYPTANCRFPLKFAFLSTIFIYSWTVVMVIFSLSTSEQKSLDILTVLIAFRCMMFLASTEIVVLNILYKHSFKTDLFWNYRKLCVMVFLYFLTIIYTH